MRRSLSVPIFALSLVLAGCSSSNTSNTNKAAEEKSTAATSAPAPTTPPPAAEPVAPLPVPPAAKDLPKVQEKLKAKPAPPAAAKGQTFPSGLVYRELVAGTGPSPRATDMVRVHYRGTFPDGREFDSSYSRNEPAEFPLNGVIPCWTEGVQKMKVGGKASLTCPASIAYGERGRPGIPGGATLLFDVELLAIR
jgi:FKBP-type peptidyl-prolyl cis-trans isomerase FkpA